MKHSLDIVDRGTQHRHRWLPVCSCGSWHPYPIRDRGRAAEMYRAHVRSVERTEQATTRVRTARWGGRRGRLRRIAGPAGPKPLTPVDQLPPELR